MLIKHILIFIVAFSLDELLGRKLYGEFQDLADLRRTPASSHHKTSTSHLANHTSEACTKNLCLKFNICGERLSRKDLSLKESACTGEKISRLQARKYYWSVRYPPDTLPIAKISTNSPPIPGSSNFHNYSRSEAYELLRGRTIVLAGDSSIRRLFSTLCTWLSDEITFLAKDFNGPGHYSRDYCNFGKVTKENDILLLYDGVLFLKDLETVINRSSIQSYLTLRNEHELKGARKGSRTISKELMPVSKSPTSLHVFSLINTYHERPAMLKGNKAIKAFISSDMLEKLSEVNESKYSLNVACALYAETLRRFAWIERYNESKIFFHGMSLTPGVETSYRVSRNNDTINLAYAGYLLKNDHLFSHSECKKYIPDDSCGDQCGFVDQATWTASRNFPLKDGESWYKLDDKGQVLRSTEYISKEKPEWRETAHIYNEKGQMLRIQNLLNSLKYSIDR